LLRETKGEYIMYKVLILALTFLLSGCYQTVNGEDIIHFSEMCEEHGGINYISAGNSSNGYKDFAVCKDNGVTVTGES
jgi:predicted small secreted protein